MTFSCAKEGKGENQYIQGQWVRESRVADGGSSGGKCVQRISGKLYL